MDTSAQQEWDLYALMALPFPSGQPIGCVAHIQSWTFFSSGRPISQLSLETPSQTHVEV